MGNCLSTKKIRRTPTDNNECFICWENINAKNIITCMVCNIKLHDSCEKRYKKTMYGCRCPHCQQINQFNLVKSNNFYKYDFYKYNL
jgi:hypothetical protein